MVRDGMRVPDGFVVTTDAYADFMAGAGFESEARAGRASLDRKDAAAVAAWSARMTTMLEASSMPAQLERAIRDAYEELCRRCGVTDVPVAVRSSGVAEDLEGASYAGQYDTYLWITGADAVVEHVKRCWSGLFGAPVLTYEPTAEAEAAGADMPAMAVGVQRMVDARAAGVMLTLDPLNGDRSKIVIEGSWGLGEAVVSGEVTPDRFRLDKITRAVEQEIAVKEREYSHDGASGLILREVPDERREQPCLEAGDVDQLAELGRDLERRRGAPQDIEWAIAQDGVVHVLQARPETIWSSRRPPSTVASGASALDLVLQQFTGSRT
jgi:phosphoenolpyruvate synthase/pyruvate phosphate dikinase